LKGVITECVSRIYFTHKGCNIGKEKEKSKKNIIKPNMDHLRKKISFYGLPVISIAEIYTESL
jgi:hypothetical protein